MLQLSKHVYTSTVKLLIHYIPARAWRARNLHITYKNMHRCIGAHIIRKYIGCGYIYVNLDTAMAKVHKFKNGFCKGRCIASSLQVVATL